MSAMSDNDRIVIEEWLNTFLAGVTPLPLEPVNLEQSTQLFHRVQLVQRAIKRAAEDPRMSRSGRRRLNRSDAFDAWLDKQERWLMSQGAL